MWGAKGKKGPSSAEVGDLTWVSPYEEPWYTGRAGDFDPARDGLAFDNPSHSRTPNASRGSSARHGR